jgi:hypothetical protein
MGHAAEARSVKLLFSRPNGPRESVPPWTCGTCRRPVVLAATLLPTSMPMARVNAQRNARKGPSDEKSVAGVGGLSDGSAAMRRRVVRRVVNGRLVAESEVA